MPIRFQLDQRLGGFTASSARDGQVWICQRELVGPADAVHLSDRLEKFQDALFSKIPSLPQPSAIDHLLVVINRDLSATAYVNELAVMMKMRVNRNFEAGEPVYVRDIDEIASVELGIEIPTDAAIVVVNSFGWRRALFFDLAPLSPDAPTRDYPLDAILAQQLLLLLGLPVGLDTKAGPSTRAERMQRGIDRLEQLLAEKCEDESQYQQLLAAHPWMLGRSYSEVIRHQAFDDSAIPDFTAVRCYDGCHDIIELKQPFLQLFKANGSFAAPFNDAWNQLEAYLQFSVRNRSYLQSEKGLRFENPVSILICGHGLEAQEISRIREKESISRAISVLTYDHLLGTARHVLELVRKAGDRLFPVPDTIR